MADKDKGPGWFATVSGDVLAAGIGAVAGVLGADWLKGDLKETLVSIGKKAGEKATKQLLLDREDISKELMRLRENGRAILRLLERANAQGGILEVRVGDRRVKRYLEHEIVSLLLKVEPKDRQWFFAKLNALLERNPREFFAHLEIIRNDGWLQYLKLAKAIVGEAIESMKEKLPESKELKRRLGSADEALNDSALTWRSKKRWWLRRSRSRQRQLNDQLQKREEQRRQQREQQARDRVAELFDRFRRERDEEGGRQ